MQPDQTVTEAMMIRRWLLRVIADTGMKPTPLAKAAGLAPSTILRALDEANPSSLERRFIRKIVSTFNCAEPAFAAEAAPPRGFAEPDLSEPVRDMPVFAGLALTPNQFVATVLTRAIDLAGYIPGDLVLFDMAEQPRGRDIVCAQIYGGRGAHAETVLRIFDPPYLTTETLDPSARAKPVLVDHDRVKIMATAIRTLRQRP